MNTNDWLALTRRRANQLDAWEATQVAALSAPLGIQLKALLIELSRRYLISFGSIYARDPDPAKIAAISTWLDNELALVSFDRAAPQIIEATKKPYVHGMVTAALMLGTVLAVANREPVITPDAKETAGWAVGRAAGRITEARDLTRQADSWGGFTTAMAKAHQARTALEIGASAAIVRAAANGIKAYGDSSDVTIIWVCQPGACPICLPYDGSIMGEGGSFMAADNSVADAPPVHNRCACRLGVADSGISSIVGALKAGAYQDLED